MAKWYGNKAAYIVNSFMEPDLPEKMLVRIGTGTVRFVSRLNDRDLQSLEKSDKYIVVHDD
jgi:hypothetical protein